MKIELINEAHVTGKIITGTEKIKEFKLTDVLLGERTLILNVSFMLSDSDRLDIICDIPLGCAKEQDIIVAEIKRDILMFCFKFNHSDINSLISAYNIDILKQCCKYILIGYHGERNKVIWNTNLDSYYMWATSGVYED